MVLGWKDGSNSVMDKLLEKIRRLEERVTLLEGQISENQLNILSAVGVSKRTDRTESGTLSFSGFQIQQQQQ
jgi:hypothetical protein